MTDPYRSSPGVNWSTLKHLRESALKYRHALTQPVPETTAMALGRAAHALVFEPQVFEREFAIYEGETRRGKEWEAFKDAHMGQTILKASEIDAAMGMSNAVRVHPLVAPYLEGGMFEQPVYWTDPATAMACKAKPDWVLPPTRVLIDLKTTASIDAFRFGRIAARLGYHCQLAMYANACEHGLGWVPEKVAIVAVESEAPYDVAVFTLDEDTLYAGREEVGKLMEQLKGAREADLWPGRYVTEQALLLPQYVFGDEDEDAAGLGVTFGNKEG